MPTVHRELEVKYDADADVRVPSLVEVFATLRGGPGAPGADGSPLAEGDQAVLHLAATYYDTAELDLAAGGLTLRRRTGGDDEGWHLKVPVPDGSRSEVRVPLDEGDRTVPDRLADLVVARTGGRPLVPVARIETDRTVRRLVDATGRVLAELADDRVSARRLHPSAEPGEVRGAVTTWREVEVEVVDGSDSLLAALDPLLRDAGLRPAATGSKLRRALDLGAGGEVAGGSPPPAGTTDGHQVPAGGVVLLHVRAQVEQIRAQDLLVRLDVPGAVHAMRVATRRLRSTLRTFRPLLAGEGTEPLREELKWLAGVLGAARDAEVMRDRLSTSVDQEHRDGRVPDGVADDVRAELDRAYRRAHDEVLVQLGSDRHRALLAALADLADRPPLTERAAQDAVDALPGLVARADGRVRTAKKAADRAADADERTERLHEVRKAAKRARYAAEAVAPVFGDDARAFAAGMEEVQEALGEHLDSTITGRRLRELALETSSPGSAFAYGLLQAQEGDRARQAAHDAEAAWERASRKRLRRWLR